MSAMRIATCRPRSAVRAAIAQIDSVPGDVAANLQLCREAIDEARALQADLVALPELALTGPDVTEHMPQCARPLRASELEVIARESADIAIAVGFVEEGRDGNYYNAAAFFEDGQLLHVHRKLYLVSYGLFDERRSFAQGRAVRAFDSKLGRIAMIVCEDAWHLPVPYLAVMDGACILLTLAASPSGMTSGDVSSQELWFGVNRTHAVTLKVFNVFANQVGGERRFAFWGESHIISPTGRTLARAGGAGPELVLANLDLAELREQRLRYPYVREERLGTTLRELQRLAARDGESHACERAGWSPA
jgi:NAD+ synthase (glutamine-hydrolysing)